MDAILNGHLRKGSINPPSPPLLVHPRVKRRLTYAADYAIKKYSFVTLK